MTEPNATPRRWPKILAAVLLVLVLAGVAAAFTLDRVLTSAARDQVARLAVAWQRPVEIGAVKTTILTGLGVRVEAVRIGAAAGEPRPLLELDRAEVKLELLRALRSGGKDVRVRSIELQGLRVAVVRLKDGSSNLQRLADALAKDQAAEPPAAAGTPPAEEKPANLSMLRIEHASVLGARIAFVDETAGGRELLVEQIDLVVDGFAAGAPLDLTLRAGLLSARQNLELKIHSPPLPASLVPSPDRLTLKVAPVDLTPLAAFAPREVGFQGGRFTADLDVELGAAVAGGAGATTVHGGFAATGLRFAGQEGGKALDVTLDADLTADTSKGDLSITRLLLGFGPAALEGKGKVSGLLSDHPTVEGLRIVSRNLDLAALAPYYPPLPKLLGGTFAGPIALSLEAAGTVARPVLELRADLTPVRIAVARQVEKAAGGKLAFTARVRGGAGGALGFDIGGDLSGLDLRPGGTLAKKPGDRFTLAAAGSRRVAGDAQTLEIGSLLHGAARHEAGGAREAGAGAQDHAIRPGRGDRPGRRRPAAGGVGAGGGGAREARRHHGEGRRPCGEGRRVALCGPVGPVLAPGGGGDGAKAEGDRPARHAGGEGGRGHLRGRPAGDLGRHPEPGRDAGAPRAGRSAVQAERTGRGGAGRQRHRHLDRQEGAHRPARRRRPALREGGGRRRHQAGARRDRRGQARRRRSSTART